MALPATDSFTTGSDQSLTSYSSNWTYNNGAFGVLVASGDVHSDAVGEETGAHWNADSFDADQYAELTINAVTIGGFLIGPAVRCHASAATWYEYYANSTEAYLASVVAGSWAQIGSAGDAWSASDVARLEISGVDPGTLTPYINDVEDSSVGGAQTDSDIDSGYAGIAGYSGSTTSRGDNWEGGNLAGGPADLTISVSDGATVADSPTITPLVLANVSVSDALTVADSPTVARQEAAALAIDVNDGATVADSTAIDPLILGAVTVSDAITVGDTPTVTLGTVGAYAISVSDALTVADAVTVDPLVLADVSVSDALTIGESATPLLIEADLNADKGADDYANWVVGVRLYTP